jgi:uridine kinase
MEGDKLVIKDHHVKTAKEVAKVVIPEIKKSKTRYAITVAGESGSGKSETAYTIKQELESHHIKCFIFQQDDYFVYPPKTNAKMREKDINHVGTSEVKLELLDNNIKEAIEGKNEITKPLVYFDEDKVEEEKVNLEGIDVVIAEGTYTTSLSNAHKKVFIDKNYFDTKKTRIERSREKQDDFLEQILEIEHKIISGHKSLAHLIITKDNELKTQ